MIPCKHCGGEMLKTTRTERDYALQLLGVALFLLAVLLLFFFPIGTIIGVILMIPAARIGHKTSKVWSCRKCGAFHPRMN